VTDDVVELAGHPRALAFRGTRLSQQPALVEPTQLGAGDGRGDEALALLARIPESAETRRVAALARLGSVDGDGAGAGADDGLAARLDGLLDRVKDDEDARREFLDVLELLGPEDPRTAAYRKALTARLF
jgi:putative thioredoxin